METNKILTADVLDIIFEGRNKEYGAYELRKTYRNRLVIAIIATLLVCLIFFIGSFIANNLEDDNSELQVQDVNLEQMQQEEEKQPEPPPPPPPPPQEPPKVEITKFTPPKIVEDKEVKPDEEPPPQEKLDDSKIGKENVKGTEDQGFIEPPPEPTGTGAKIEKEPEEDYDKIFTVVQQEAAFPGGLAAWSRFVERNLDRELPANNGAPAGKYTVTVSFIVDKEGKVSEVKAENDPGYGTASEAVRVIKKGPNWTPALQNGRNVISRKKQNITFVVEE
jgi:periplasmic protein TonB